MYMKDFSVFIGNTFIPLDNKATHLINKITF